MSVPNNALLTGLYNRLSGYASLTALVGTKIYDRVPPGTTPPYIRVDGYTIIEGDTKSANGWEATVTVHCWDYSADGMKSINTLMGHIYDALHRQESNITVSGFSLLQIVCEYQESFQDTTAAGATDLYYHGVQRFRVLIRS